jgi:hypothetical protein
MKVDKDAPSQESNKVVARSSFLNYIPAPSTGWNSGKSPSWEEFKGIVHRSIGRKLGGGMISCSMKSKM